MNNARTLIIYIYICVCKNTTMNYIVYRLYDEQKLKKKIGEKKLAG